MTPLVPTAKQEVRRLSSQYPDGSLMYPGQWAFTYVRFGATWMLLSIAPYQP